MDAHFFASWMTTCNLIDPNEFQSQVIPVIVQRSKSLASSPPSHHMQTPWYILNRAKWIDWWRCFSWNLGIISYSCFDSPFQIMYLLYHRYHLQFSIPDLLQVGWATKNCQQKSPIISDLFLISTWDLYTWLRPLRKWRPHGCIRRSSFLGAVECFYIWVCRCG